jgi:hypothetical protein
MALLLAAATAAKQVRQAAQAYRLAQQQQLPLLAAGSPLLPIA